MFVEVPKYSQPNSSDGRDPRIDSALASIMPTEAIGRHAVGVPFDIYCAWIDSGDPDLRHYLTGEAPMDAEVVRLPEPKTRSIGYHAIAS